MTQKNKVKSSVYIHLVLHPMKMSGEWMELQPFFISKWIDPLYYISALTDVSD